MNTLIFFGAVAAVAVVILTLVTSMMFRTVVKTNIVHIVQSSKKTISYGTGQPAGNVYFAWPSWLPRIGVTVREFPISNFQISLPGYEAYDKDRVPFVVDVVAFFRVDDPVAAATRVFSVQDLREQLTQITQGTVRKVLANSGIDEIMTQRAKFGAEFTEDTSPQLAAWGVTNVKAMELMDIRDAKDTKNVHNIMAKKTSHIEMESRIEVASNMKSAQTAEIDAQREVMVRKQDAEQLIGERTAQKDQLIGVAKQKADQEVLTQQKETKTREMEVAQVVQVRSAEIEKSKQIVFAEQTKATQIIAAEAQKQQQIIEADGEKAKMVTVAQGHLEAETNRAQAIEKVGAAEGAAATAIKLADVTPQITLAKEIGANEGYQKYLLGIKNIEATQIVGVANAKALQEAEIKIISSAMKPTDGLESVSEMFTPTGGLKVANMLESFGATDAGKAVLDKLGISPQEGGESPPEPGKKVANLKKAEWGR